MSPVVVSLLIAAYFILLLIISYFTGKKASNETFFLGNRKSPWYLVAYAMIGTSISGVTFISVPGWVYDSKLSYMQMVLGYLLGYFVIANILMPLYYRMRLISIYTYLESRFGTWSYKTGASFFLLSRTIGSALRLYLVANVLYITVFKAWGVPFELTVVVTILLIWLYTFRGGIKTIIWTDLLQTSMMLLAVVFTVLYIGRELNLGIGGIVSLVEKNDLSRIFFFDDWQDQRHFMKQFLSGAFISIVMTGLDQDMMQKNLSCRNLADAKKNMYWFSLSLVPINLLFLSLGILLYYYAGTIGLTLPERSDDLYPMLATQGYLKPVVGFMFIIGVIAAAYSSADSALTALTTSFTVDILNTKGMEEQQLKKVRYRVHIGISIVMVLVIILFRIINNQSVISAVFTVAGYTYGPLLGLYSFGLFTRRKVYDRWVPVVTILSPALCSVVSYFSADWFHGYRFGFELLILNGLITFLGLWLISRKKNTEAV